MKYGLDIDIEYGLWTSRETVNGAPVLKYQQQVSFVLCTERDKWSLWVNLSSPLLEQSVHESLY